ncbi:hypothetical protein BCO18430_06744 [Burkholderia contaminans]|nr:hypothetical protein BCO18430_06744 [Burkholderia contaminans]
MRACEKLTMTSGDSIRLTPPASAMLLSRERRLSQARCRHTSDDEQAVSIAMLGPVRPSTNDSRPAAMFSALPVPA